jgi:UDP-N-acetylmuramate dehydrogenase
MDLADVPVLLDVYPAGEENTWWVTSQTVADRMTKDAPVLATPDDAVAWLASHSAPGDVILTFGAGDVTVVGDRLVEALRRQESTLPHPALASIPLPGTDAMIQRDAPMSRHTTMRIGGPADFLVRASVPAQIEAAAGWAAAEGLPVTVIGGGSNLLVSDAGIRGLVIVVRTPGQKAGSLLDVDDEGDAVLLRVAAQAPISWVGRTSAERGWAGMDWAVGLPGQVGGATVNNAGAHGTETKDHLVGIEVLEDGVLREYDRSWLEPAFRMTRIKGASRPRPWIVTRAIFRLPKGDPAALVALADEHAAFRKTTQPTGACSGSVFVNPEGDFAGRLLEQAGVKGLSVGGVRFSDKHANWIINSGGGTAADTWELINRARNIVAEREGVDLHPEIERIGDWADLRIAANQTGQDQADE